MGGILSLSPDYGFVLEDEEGICGYAIGTEHVKPFVKKCKLTWIPCMQEKYHKPDCEKDLSDAEARATVVVSLCVSRATSQNVRGLPSCFILLTTQLKTQLFEHAAFY